jgi:hypothetical protein
MNRQLGVKALDEKLAKMKNLPVYTTSTAQTVETEVPKEISDSVVINLSESTDVLGENVVKEEI